MTDFIQTWREIEAEFDADEELDAETFLEGLSRSHKAPPLAIGDAAPDVLRSAFDTDETPSGPDTSRYVIRERLETGGQSEIYLAERSDGVYRKTVVIKVMTQRYGGDFLKESFLREMQLLADLSHPGIVQILDGGINEEGVPWLILEHIDGLHLDEYCRRESLDRRNIAGLFIRLCESMRFVHLAGVTHLDIKASNVLIRVINGEPWPVVIDFGIALDAAMHARSENRPIYGTRGYCAPEQARGEASDHRADIYAIGMLMAQILSTDAVDNIGLLDARAREKLLVERGVNPDLVEIIRKCTRERPEDRYPSTEALRNDLNNWLQDFPLQANRARPLHVIAKTVKRHKLVSAASVLVLLSSVFFTWKYTTDVTALQSRTQQQRNATDRLFNFMLTDLFDNLTRIGRIDMLRITAERSLEHLAAQDRQTFDSASWLQSGIAYTNAGKVFDALESTEQALASYELAETQLDQVAKDPAMRREYLRHRSNLGVLRSLTLATSGQRMLTESNLETAIALANRLVVEFPQESPDTLWEAQLQLGWHFMEYNEPARALPPLQAARELAIDEARATEGTPEHARWASNLSHTLQALAWYAFDYGELEDALVTIEEALSQARLTLSTGAEDIEYTDNLRILLNQKSYFLIEAGQTEPAAESIAESIEIGRQLQLMAPRNRKYLRELAFSYTTAGELAEQRGELEKALEAYQRSLALSRSIFATDPGGYSSANDLAIDLVNVANVLKQSGQAMTAEPLWNEAVQLMRPVHQGEPDNKYYAFTLAVPLIQLGKYDEARPLIASIRASGMDDERFGELLREHGLD